MNAKKCGLLMVLIFAAMSFQPSFGAALPRKKAPVSAQKAEKRVGAAAAARPARGAARVEEAGVAGRKMTPAQEKAREQEEAKLAAAEEIKERALGGERLTEKDKRILKEAAQIQSKREYAHVMEQAGSAAAERAEREAQEAQEAKEQEELEQAGETYSRARETLAKPGATLKERTAAARAATEAASAQRRLGGVEPKEVLQRRQEKLLLEIEELEARYKALEVAVSDPRETNVDKARWRKEMSDLRDKINDLLRITGASQQMKKRVQWGGELPGSRRGSFGSEAGYTEVFGSEV